MLDAPHVNMVHVGGVWMKWGVHAYVSDVEVHTEVVRYGGM